MTTRADLEREREALVELRDQNEVAERAFLGTSLVLEQRDVWARGHDALTASIARLDALLSLSDEDAAMAFAEIGAVLSEHDAEVRAGTATAADEAAARVFRTVADLVRRAP
jgi:hypothetical protein